MNKYNISAGRHEKQIEKMKKLTDSGVCAFCPEYFIEHHDNPIEFETKHWIVTKNDYPYKHTTTHLLIILREHARSMKEITKESRAEFMEVLARIEKQFDLNSFALGMRVGDMFYNGGSVEHLHAHVVVGDFSDPKNHNKVRFKMSSVPDNI
ncbi:hypothetical protein A3F37_02320 [Candidatus Saccharibacteria bacterium RIFCSPHIGHO2_12_FULL_41_12]|nr:MAG: hypothetical protein A3F37_02320 [Candidatus Saccharibacteria bacterium RIFCSPHIGHO2_12_FULL_41_12]